MSTCKIGYDPSFYTRVMANRILLDDKAFLNFLIDLFNESTASAIVDAIASGNFNKDTVFSQSEGESSIKIIEEPLKPGNTQHSFYTPKPFHSFFEGGMEGRQYKQAWNQFLRELVSRLVYDAKTGRSIPDPNRLNGNGINIVTQEIYNYIKDLIGKIAPVLNIKVDTLPFNTSSDNWTELIGLVVDAFNNALVKNRIFLDSDIKNDPNFNEAYTAYAILSSIDELLDRSGLVSIKPEYAGKNIFTKDKYIWTGNGVAYIEKYNEEDADINDYTSPIVSLILDTLYLDKENSHGKIGLNGFTAVVGRMASWLRTTSNKDVRNEFEKGLDANWPLLIDSYKRDLGKRLTTLEKNILNVIKEDIFNSKMHKDLKDLFSAQILNTNRTVYLEVNSNSDGSIEMKTTESHIYDQTVYSLKRALAGTIGYIASNSELFKAYAANTNISVSDPKNNTITITVSLPNNKNFIINVDFSKINTGSASDVVNAITADIEGLSREDIKAINDIVSLWTGITVPNVIASEIPLFRILGLAVGLSNPRSGVNINNYISFNNTYGSYNFIPGNFNSNCIASDIDNLSDILGTSVVQTIRDINGNILPNAQLNSWYTTVDHTINQARSIAGHALKDNLIVNEKNKRAYLGTGIRKTIKVGNKSKNMKDLTPSEALHWSIVYDFLKPLADSDSKVWIQPMVFADKIRQFLDHIDLSEIHIDLGRSQCTLYDAIVALKNGTKLSIDFKAHDPLKVIKDAIIDQRKKSALHSAAVLIENAVKAFGPEALGLSFPSGSITTAEFIYDFITKNTDNFNSVWNKINQKLADTGDWNAIASVYKAANSTLHGSVEEQIDIVKTTDGKYILNPLLKHTIDTFSSEEESEKYFQSMENQFASELNEVGFRLSPETIPNFSKLGANVNVNIKVNGVLNPLLQAYLYTHLLVGEQLQEVHQGSFWNYRTKKTFDPNNPNYQADIAHRFIDQSKRAMGAGATIKRIVPRQWGVGSIWRAAAVTDLVSPVNGLTSVYKEEELVADGCTYVNPEQAILENRSLPDGKVNNNFKKLIFSQIDKGGAMNQIKTATFTITNEVRRRNPHSVEMNMEKVYRMTHQDEINLDSWVSDYYRIDGTSITKDNHNLTHTEPVYYWNSDNNSYYKILAVGFNENGLYRVIQAVDRNGDAIESTSNIEFRPPLNNDHYSMYDLDQLFGGAWCMKLDKANKTLVNSDSNNVILANMMCGRQELKNSIIHYIVPISSFKVGMQNINDSSVFNLHQPDSKLWEFNLDPYSVGVQLNAGHYVEGGYVTEPSQLMQALGQEGVLVDLVDNIYNELVNITKSIREKFSQADLKQSIAEELLYSINHSGSSKTITDVFIMRMQNKIEQRVDVKLPLSSPGINQKFEQVILQSLNRSIKHRFPGLGTVQAPSWGYMQHFGNGLTYKELLSKLTIPSGYTIKQAMEGVWNGKYLDETFVNDMISARDDSGRLPIVEEISTKQIDFEDTLLIKDAAGYRTVKIDGIKKYDEYRNLRPDTTVLRWNTQGRDLLQQIVRFNIRGDASGNFYTLYDFDASRSTFYLSEIIKDKKYPEFWEEKRRIILSTLSRGKTPEEIKQIENVLNSPLSNIETLKTYLKAAKEQFKEDCISYSNTNKVNTSFKFFMNAAGGDVELNIPKVQHAQIILGRLYAKKLGLKAGDNVRTILDQGTAFFEERLKNQFSKSTTLNGLVDATFYTEDGQIQVVIGDNPGWSEMAKVSRIFNNVNGSIYYKGNPIKGAEGIEFGTFVDSDGNTHDFVKVKNARQLRALQNNGQLGYLEYNYTKSNIKRLNTILNRGLSDEVLSKNNIGNTVDSLRSGEKERKKGFIHQWAKGRFEAFKSSLTMVGARIPTQALQSVSAVDVIGFTDSTENEVYLPKVLTWVAGSDYDIDKFYVMGWNILDDGRLPHKGNLYEYSQEEVDSLPNPTGEEFEIYYPNQDDLYSPEDIITININDLRSEGIKILKQVLESGKHIIHFVGFSNDTGTPTAMEELCLAENFVSTLNRYNNDTNAKRVSRFSSAIAMNNALRNIIHGFDDVSVQDALLSPLNTDETDRLADKNAEAKADKTKFNPDLPTSIFKQQYNNMVGKASVGIVAQNTKTFNVVTYNINAKLNNLARNLLVDNISVDAVRSYLDSITFTSPLHPGEGRTHVFGGLNFRSLINALKLKGENALANEVQVLQHNSLKNDPYDGLSNLMSAATDNAKLLDLSPLNATGNILNLYCYLVSIGESLEDAANLFTSKIFNIVNKFVPHNIFETDTSEYSALRDALNFLMDTGELNIVNRGDLTRLYYQRIKYLYDNNDTFKSALKAATEDLVDNNGNPIPITIGGSLNLNEASISQAALKIYRNWLKQDLNGTEWTELLKAAKDFPATRNSKNHTVRLTYYIENYLKLKYQLLSNVDSSELEKLETAYNLLGEADEFTSLGRFLKINQGQGGTSYEQYKIIANFNNSINSKYTENKADADFDLSEFFRPENEAYRIAQINKYENIKARVNILDFIYNSPHFREMYNSVVKSGDIITANSLTSALIARLAKKHTIGFALSPEIYNIITKYISDVITYTFIKNLPKSFAFKYGDFKDNDIRELVGTDMSAPINHVSANGGSYFKRFVERVLIPELKTGKFSSNAFVQNLVPVTDYKNGIKTFNYSITTGTGEFDQTAEHYEAIKSGFLELASQKLDNWTSEKTREWTYGDVFYLYHLMISGERYGSRGLGALFSELVTNKAFQSPLASSFLEAVSNLDAQYQEDPTKIEELLPLNETDLQILIDIAKGDREASGIFTQTDKVFKFQGEVKPADPKPYQDLKLESKPRAGRELPFELYNIFKDIFGQNNIQLTSNEFLANNRTRLFNNLSDEEFNSLANAHGFIHNGIIYLNQDNFSGSTMFHEFAHIIAAHVKFSDNPWYYQAVDMLWNSDTPNINRLKKEIERSYPNRSVMDKKEELFAEYIARSVMDNFKDITSDGLKTKVDNAVRQLFRIEPESIDFSRLSVSKIEDVLSVFKSALFSTSGTAFDSTKIILSQKLSSIKNKMLNTLMGKEKVNIDGKLVDETMLIEDCK